MDVHEVTAVGDLCQHKRSLLPYVRGEDFLIDLLNTTFHIGQILDMRAYSVCVPT
jgi:hypothetical protein